MSQAHGVHFISIARVSDGVIVAKWTHPKDAAQKNHFTTTVSNLTTNKTFSSRAVPNKRFCLLSTDFSVNFIADEDGFAFVVLTEKQYPERVVFKMIAELQSQFDEFRGDAHTVAENKLNRQLYDVFVDLGERYADPAAIDRIAKAQRAVDHTAQQLEKNLEDLEELHISTSELAKNSGDLLDESHTLKETSAEYHKRMKCRKYMITAAIVGAIVVLIAVIVIPIAVKFARRSRHLRG